MYETIYSAVQAVDDLVWGWAMIILLLGTHIFMTIRTKGIQRKVFKGIKLSVTKDPDAEGEVSQFGALTTALAATIGTGNIIGVGTAIALGGPGAVLWCWLTGVFGIATKYSEALISVKYRVKTRDGRMLGGLHAKWLGLLFAIFGGLASFGIGCATQVNAIASVCNENLGIPTWIIGIVVGVLVAMVIFGGIKSIANVCEKLVPFMAFFYVFGCIIILCFNYDFIIPALQTICTLAFKPGAAAGGLIGGGIMQAMHYGVARGLFSNESGMGSAPIAAAAAQTRNPVRQALVSSTGTFWDTVVVCAMTLGPVILVMGIITFAFSTVLGWAYYGERCIEYFAGKKIMIPYRVLYIIVAVIAPIAPLNLIWLVADILNALMAIPNLIAVLLLSPVIVMETKKYLNNLDMKDDTPVPYEDEV